MKYKITKILPLLVRNTSLAIAIVNIDKQRKDRKKKDIKKKTKFSRYEINMYKVTGIIPECVGEFFGMRLLSSIR